MSDRLPPEEHLALLTAQQRQVFVAWHEKGAKAAARVAGVCLPRVYQLLKAARKKLEAAAGQAAARKEGNVPVEKWVGYRLANKRKAGQLYTTSPATLGRALREVRHAWGHVAVDQDVWWPLSLCPVEIGKLFDDEKEFCPVLKDGQIVAILTRNFTDE